jgi:2-amino-4-hydroxy-6-hydroxymethyldihydropteridine diphosphokinase
VSAVSDGSEPAASTRVFVGLGANLGKRRRTIELALQWLADHPAIRLVRRSEVIETEPWGRPDQPLFLNAVAEIETTLEPRPLLTELKGCERALGRDPEPGPRWGPREIDLDILLYGDCVLHGAELTIPHPRLLEREFVLRQLRDLDPELMHPLTGKLVSSYLRVT